MTLVANTSSRLKTPKIYSLAEYLAKEEQSIHKHEFYNGYIFRKPVLKYKRNKICSNVIYCLGNAIEKIEDKIFLVLNSDQKKYIPSENVSLYSDALVISEKPIFWENREDLLLNPLVIVEVASKGTRGYDRGEKFMSYKSIPSFKEYVLIEQDKHHVETWFRQDAETWKVSVVEGIDAIVSLRSIAVALALKDIYKHLV
jgi:Uma2 family endonuclease